MSTPPTPDTRRSRRETVDDPRAAAPSVGHFLLLRTAEALVGLALIALAAWLALDQAPRLLRLLVTLPVVVGASGRAVSLLVLNRPLTDGDPDRRATVDEPTLRAVAPVLFGVIATLASILLAALGRVTITGPHVVWAASLMAAVLHVVAAYGHRAHRHRALTSAGARAVVVRVVVPAVAALVVLGLAVAGARSVEATSVERYTQLSLVDPTLYATGQLRTTPGARVSLGWVYRAYAESIPDNPATSMTIAGTPAGSIERRLLDPSADPTDADASRRGEISGLAPAAKGLYRLALTVGEGDQAQTLYLVLEVVAG